MPIRGLLIDLEGVLYQNGRVIEGAIETIRNLQATGTAFRFLTNTTTISRNRVVSAMTDMGFDVDAAAVFTPAIAAGQFLEARNIRRVHLAAPMELAEDFKSFEQVEENPEAIILGDLHTAFTWQRLDGIFRMLQGGAMLIALHKNRYCRRGEALSLDIGPFVAALEYATRRSALVMGKPDTAFFSSAVENLTLPAGDVMMIGDDMDADIGGALRAGLRAVQVRTGKYNPDDQERDGPQPEARIGSIRDISSLLA